MNIALYALIVGRAMQYGLLQISAGDLGQSMFFFSQLYYLIFNTIKLKRFVFPGFCYGMGFLNVLFFVSAFFSKW